MIRQRAASTKQTALHASRRLDDRPPIALCARISYRLQHDQHGEMHWIKPHAVSLCCAAVLLGGGASWKRETAANGLRQSRQGRAADLVEVSMPSVSAAAFPIRLLASDGGTHQPRNRKRPASACLKM